MWLVDPRDRTIVVYRLDSARYVLLGTWGGEDEAVRLEPFDAVEIPPASLWGRRVPQHAP